MDLFGYEKFLIKRDQPPPIPNIPYLPLGLFKLLHHPPPFSRYAFFLLHLSSRFLFAFPPDYYGVFSLFYL